MKIIFAVLVISILACHKGEGVKLNKVPATPLGGGPPPASNAPINGNPDEKKGTLPTQNLLVVIGGVLDSLDIFTISTKAERALPTQFNSFQVDYLDVAALNKPGRAVAVAKKRYGVEYSIRKINFKTGRSYRLFTAPRGQRIFELAASRGWVAFTSDGDSNGNCSRVIQVLNIETQQVFKVPCTGNQMDQHPNLHSSEHFPKVLLTFERKSETTSGIFSISISSMSISDLLKGSLIPTSLVIGTKNENVRDLSFSPSFSPSKNHYFYLKNFDGYGRLVLSTNGVEKLVTPPKAQAFEPSWSSDGTKVLYWIETPDAQAIESYDIKLGSSVHISYIMVPEISERFDSFRGICPSFSLDMSEVYYSSFIEVWSLIYKVNTKDNKVVQLVDPNLARSYTCPVIMKDYSDPQ